MTPLLVALMLAQEPGCAAVGAAKARADVFDVRGALERLDAAAKGECPAARGQATYLRGWIAARDAYGAGGSRESLKNVDAAVAALNAGGRGGGRVCPSGRRCRRAERARHHVVAPQSGNPARVDSSVRGLAGRTSHHRARSRRRAMAAGVSLRGGASCVPARRRATRSSRRGSRWVWRAAAVRLRCPEGVQAIPSLAAAWKVSGPEPQEVVEARRFLPRGAGLHAGGK